MKFEKKGLIYCPNGEEKWMQHSFMTPVAILIEGSSDIEDIIRLFGGIRDEGGISRIGFIDLRASDPSKVIYISKKPVLDIGEDGCFDDNGLILGSLIKVKDEWRMYYVGFQLVNKVKFYAFSGLAISKNLLEFKKYSQTPIMDRKDWMRYIGAIHSVLYEDKVFKVWYAGGNSWQKIEKNYYPSYKSFYTETTDGINFDYKINKSITKFKNDEYRIGRPTIFKDKDLYRMFCTSDTLNKEYSIAYFESYNGINWKRSDDKLSGLEKSKNGWDSEMTCYPNIIKYKNKTYCFYNGNGMGKSGVGYAEIIF